MNLAYYMWFFSFINFLVFKCSLLVKIQEWIVALVKGACKLETWIIVDYFLERGWKLIINENFSSRVEKKKGIFFFWGYRLTSPGKKLWNWKVLFATTALVKDLRNVIFGYSLDLNMLHLWQWNFEQFWSNKSYDNYYPGKGEL